MREYGSQAVVWQTAINPVGRARAARPRRVEGHRRARPRGLPARAVPRAARRVRLAARVDRAAGRLTSRSRRARPSDWRPAAAAAAVSARRRAGARRLLLVLRLGRQQVHAVGDVFGAHQVGRRALDGRVEQARRGGFRLAREERAEVGPRDEHQHARRRSCPIPPNHSGSVRPEVLFAFGVFLVAVVDDRVDADPVHDQAAEQRAAGRRA